MPALNDAVRGPRSGAFWEAEWVRGMVMALNRLARSKWRWYNDHNPQPNKEASALSWRPGRMGGPRHHCSSTTARSPQADGLFDLSVAATLLDFEDRGRRRMGVVAPADDVKAGKVGDEKIVWFADW